MLGRPCAENRRVGIRAWIICVATLGVGVGGPWFFAKQLKLGDFAKSPQTVEMMLGSSILVGGGRAKLWFAQVDSGASVEVSCRKETSMLELREGEPSDKVCRVRVELLSIREKEFRGNTVLRGKFRVTWDDAED